jgi:acyl-CoA reductase-like NAD-dependent aldehyde dehydrogenase
MSSSDEFEPETTRSSSSKKRKSNGSSNTDAKKPRKVAKITDHSAAEELVEQVFDNPDYWLEAEAEELRDTVYTLAEYARDLRNALAAQDANGQQSSAPKQSREELVKTAEKLRKTAKSQIKLQMKV